MDCGVPREVPRPKPEGPQALRVFGCGTSQSDSIHHMISFSWHLRLVERDFFQPMNSLGSIMVNIYSTKV